MTSLDAIMIRNNLADFINKKYTLYSSVNFEAVMDELKVRPILHGVGKLSKPSIKLSSVNGLYTLKTKSFLKNTVVQFKLGEEFIEERYDNSKCSSVITMEGNIMTHVMKGEPECKIVRIFSSTQMIAVITVNGVVAKRTYKVD